MAPINQTHSSKLFARDIAAFNDAELDQFLEVNAGSVDVEDPENVKKDEVLLQRLRARASGQSRPIDVNDLTARLEAASANRDAPPQRKPSASYWMLVNGRHELVPVKKPANRDAPPRDRGWEAWHNGIDENGNRDPNYASRDTTEPLDEEEEYQRGLEEETQHYNTLVNEGGRPSHPLSLLGRDVFENPGEYREILSYWLTDHGLPIRQDLSFNPYRWHVFGSQLWEWRRFCKYQRATREKEGYFPRYCERVQERLARHGFERPFQLDKDLDQQDKLATWIEFLNYKYQDYDKDMRFVERHQPEYDEAWKELVDSQVLRPFETEEFIIYDPRSAVQHASEEERAEKAVESAKSAVMSAQNAIPDPRRAHLSQQATQQRLAVAQSKLDAAIKSLESIKRRNNLIYVFFKKTQLSQITNDGKQKRSYQSAKDDAQRRSILLRWILQQIPLIELELNQAKVTANDSGGEDGRKRLKRNPADDLNQERVSKRRREENGNNALSNHRTRAFITQTTSQDSSSTQRPPQTAGHEGQLKHNSHDAINEGRAIKRPRHSGQKTSNAAEPISIGEPLSIQPDRSKPNSTAAQVPKPRKRQARVYQKERESRRIAGHLPQFGMLPKRGEPAPPYTPPSRYPSNTRKPNPLSPRSHASSKKKSIAIKGAKPQGISKSRRETKRSKRSKQSRG